jgi:putative membrane-bound dehydrogenase-like protein
MIDRPFRQGGVCVDNVRRRFVSAVLAGAAGAILLTGCQHGDARAPEVREPWMPEVLDGRLKLSVFAEAPQVVTPIGIAVDEHDRVFVLESHTHTRPPHYDGPESDRVLMMVDSNGDGTADSVSVWADGLRQGMNLGFSPDGVLYVVTARGVWALSDRSGDGVADHRVQIIEMREPESVWPHAALLGLAFSSDGYLYVSRGNTGGQPYTLVGTDGSEVRGYGDGGNILRSRLDGSQLEVFATGFWNVFDLAFDTRGRLLAVDNDPDSRGPNRLLHIIQGGDYGYQSLYGGSGIHPYLAWDGELPGTLPYAAGIGEAPSGLIHGSHTSLPTDYQDEMLIAIWEESNIVRARFREAGVSVSAEVERIIQGRDDFRPVAFAADGRGNVYFTDWVQREYLNHGRGRVWRLSARDQRGVERNRPRGSSTMPEPAAGMRQLDELYALDSPADFRHLREALRSSDPFVSSAAVTVLVRPTFRGQLLEATADADVAVRTGAVLALQRAGHQGGEEIARRLLGDPDPQVRQTTLIWVGRSGMLSLRSELERAIEVAPVTPQLFEVYLATVERLTPEFVRAYNSRAEPRAAELPRSLPEGFVARFVSDPSRPEDLRAIGVLHLEDSTESRRLLLELARERGTPRLRKQAIRSLAYRASEAAGAVLLEIATDPREPSETRADALAGLGRQPIDGTVTALSLLEDPAAEVRLEAARYLRMRPLDDEGRSTVRRVQQRLGGRDAALSEQLALLPGGDASAAQRPATHSEWDTALERGTGDSARGARVFHSMQSTCSQCHVMDGRGGSLGPELSNIGRAKSRQALIRSILDPSAEISPEYQGWYIRTRSGRTHYGRQIDVGRNSIELYVSTGEFIEVDMKDIADYGMTEQSLMPAGLENNLTVSEMRDLIRYLETSR